MKINGIEQDQVEVEIDGVSVTIDEEWLKPIVTAIASEHWGIVTTWIDENQHVVVNRRTHGYPKGDFGELCLKLVEQLQAEQPGLWEWVGTELQKRFMDRPMQLPQANPSPRISLFEGSDNGS